MADFYEDKQLTMKQFLVVLAIGYVLDAIPDLLEVGQVCCITFSGGGRGGGSRRRPHRAMCDPVFVGHPWRERVVVSFLLRRSIVGRNTNAA